MIDIFAELDKNFNIARQILNIEKLLENEMFMLDSRANWEDITLKDFFNSYVIKQWQHRLGRISYAEIIFELGIDFNKNKFEIEEKKALRYLQLIHNLVWASIERVKNSNIGVYGTSFEVLVKMIKENIEYIINRLGYQIVFDEEKNYFYITKKNIKATQVAAMSNDKKIALKLYEYNYIENNNLESKKEILKVLADYVEPILKDNRISKQSNFYEIIDNCSFALNNLNIRHNNIVQSTRDFKQYTFDLLNQKPKELELWYDRTFELIMDCLMIKDFLDKRQDWLNLKNNY